MKIMVINSGSSSIKYQIFAMQHRMVLASGQVEKIGESAGHLTHQTHIDGGPPETTENAMPIASHEAGFDLINATLKETGALTDMAELAGIGHRVVHGGEAFQQPTLIDAEVIHTIRSLIPLAPLHNPANLTGIEVALALAPQVPQVAVFDTAFHQSLPPRAFRYALPQELYERHAIRRYGFHGTSHCYVAKQAARLMKRPLDALSLITLHLGNGASATAIRDGKSIDTSMGLTPLEGLIMGTRCGDLDPAIIFYLARETGRSVAAIDDLLNKDSGLRGIHRLADAWDPAARLAIEMYVYRLRKYIGSYAAALGRLDALVFTGGVGENDGSLRSAVCRDMTLLGLGIDETRNSGPSRGSREIQDDTSRVKILVVPTNEELEIAEQTKALLSAKNML
jgi:acetate kinase